MRADVLGWLSAGLMLSLSPLLLAQQTNGYYNPPSTNSDDLSELTFERPHSLFDLLERNEMRDTRPRGESSAGPAGTVSVEELRHPLSAKGDRLIDRAQRYAKAGEHAKAIDEFKLALKDPSAAPYARGLLGIEYLKTKDFSTAIAELLEAERLVPGIAANHTNLGYAFCMTGERAQAEEELRAAVKLDPMAPQPRYLLGLVLLDRRSQEAATHFSFARQVLRNAHLALAIMHQRSGDADSVKQEISAFLGPEKLNEADRLGGWVATAAQLSQPSAVFGLPPASQPRGGRK
jgi:tetratricopeptide (TPR) repeat protein